MRAKTKEEKEIAGTYQACREGEDAIEFAKMAINPPAPKEWPESIQKMWSERCNDLKNTSYLSKAFLPMLRRFCFAVYQAELAEKKLMEEGFVTVEFGSEGQQYEVVSKWVVVLDNANKTIDKFGSKFGLSPMDSFKIPKLVKEQKTMTLLK